jgi:hypothetical protein
MRAKLLFTAALGAATLALPSGARAENDLILCTGSIDGGGETCIYDSDVPVLNKHEECWPMNNLNAVGPCLNTFKPV